MKAGNGKGGKGKGKKIKEMLREGGRKGDAGEGKV